MNEDALSRLNLKSLFLVWGTPDQGPRSRVMADKLDIKAYFVHTGLPRGALYVPIKYPIQGVKTLLLLLRERPRVIFVQSPPVLAEIFTYAYCTLTGGGYVIDAHSEALLSRGWTAPPAWVKRFLAKRAVTTIVTNEHLARMVEDMEGHATIIRDIPTTFDVQGRYPTSDKFNVALINTFAADEPLNQVLAAAVDLPDVNFYVTGKIGQRNSDFVAKAPPNIQFTDFLPDQAYYGLLSSAQAVMCLTKRNHTMQRGACEALSLGRPIITSDWPILRQYFRKGTVHVDNTVDGIRQGVLKMKQHYGSYEEGIRELQTDQQREWQEKVSTLASLIQEHLQPKRRP
jgi:glycosyltransferase involved in cell wall biosynthesis